MTTPISPDLERCDSVSSLFSIPAEPDSTWAALQIWRDNHRGALVWWRIAIDAPHEDDMFGVELLDTNAQYRRAMVSSIDLRTLPTLRDEIIGIASAPSWVMTRSERFGWANDPEMTWSDRFERAHTQLDNETYTRP